MNRMELVPQNAPDFSTVRNQQRLERCKYFAEARIKCTVLAQLAEETDDASRAKSRRFVQALRQKFDSLHEENHSCYPFSIN